MQNQAEVVRFESQLTVPTRNRSHLSDLWIAISCTTSIASWADEFSAILPCDDAPQGVLGTMHVVAMSERKGWIVARGVDLTAHGSAEVEERVRSVVARVNLGTPPLQIADGTPVSVPAWLRIGTTLQAEGNACWRRVAPSRPRAAVDAMSGR